jgi:L-arabinose isomerase
MSLPDLTSFEVWLVAGSQHLYGPGPLKQVAAHAKAVAAALDKSPGIPVRVRFKAVVTTAEEIEQALTDASTSKRCVGVITWMHTFSPAKMWIAGLKALRKPLLHLHTQFNRDIPWGTIDMDFMNLNQSAHGDREFAHLLTRMNIRRKTVVGHWSDAEVVHRIGVWSRACCAWHDWQGARFCRFGDNMRNVSVTEGDKVEAQIRFGFSVDGYGMGDLVREVNGVKERRIERLADDYLSSYSVVAELKKSGKRHAALRYAARLELGIADFLENGGFKGFTNTFEDLHGLEQLPGIAVQRLMKQGYGFGAEGDWKTAALVRAMKVMAAGLPGGNSFMEDYTYHFRPGNEQVLGAHMLEICESVARGKPSCEIHPLSIGGKADPVRLVFGVAPGSALNASLVDLGDHFRLVVNEVQAVKPEKNLPKLPVARVLWKPLPDMKAACELWLEAGGAHHTCFSQSLTTEHLEDFARIADLEIVTIGRA